MTDEAVWIPRGVDTSKSSAARLYDYLLGGGHNFAVDRELGERFAVALPGARDIARLNRALLRRAVLTLAESGIRQFLDVGSGIPTVGNVHEIAQQADPGRGSSTSTTSRSPSRTATCSWRTTTGPPRSKPICVTRPASWMLPRPGD